MIGKNHRGSASIASVQPKHRRFVREVAKGRTPEEVVRELYPNEDPAVALRRVQTPKVLTLLESFVSARWEKTVLLSRLSGIIEDARTKQGERIAAIRLGAQVSGYLSKTAAYKPSRRLLKVESDTELEARLAKLAKQALQSSKPI